MIKVIKPALTRNSRMTVKRKARKENLKAKERKPLPWLLTALPGGAKQIRQVGVRSCTVSTIFASASPPPLIYNTHNTNHTNTHTNHPRTQLGLETMKDLLESFSFVSVADGAWRWPKPHLSKRRLPVTWTRLHFPTQVTSEVCKIICGTKSMSFKTNLNP